MLAMKFLQSMALFIRNVFEETGNTILTHYIDLTYPYLPLPF
jgi:hypothetical protein